MKPGHQGFQRLIKATGYSWLGLKACYQNEAAFRQELLACLFLLPLAFYITDNAIEQSILIFSLFFIIVCEVFNSAIEAVVDLQGGEFHILAGRAKDMGSAAVLLAIIASIIIWISIILSKPIF